MKLALPKSMEIDEVFDHRESIRAIGLGGYEVVEVAANLMKVREAIWAAIWAEKDLVRSMPSMYIKDFQQRLATLYAGPRTARKRRLLVARKVPFRRIHNLEQVQDFLSAYNFETVYLEGMSVLDQILLFQSAEFVIGAHGAGLSNLLFCDPGTKVIELMPTAEMRPFFWMISAKLELVHGMQFCPPVGTQGFQSDISVDLRKLKTLVEMVDAHW